MKNNASDIISFLRELSANNNRDWFMAHRDRYVEAKAKFEAIGGELMAGIADFDPSCKNLTLKDCTYRIYRDVRFSQDKSPYKTHMGLYVCPQGKKSGYAGYYFHIGTGLTDGYPGCHMLAVGDYRYDPAVVKILREDIHYGDGEFQHIVEDQVAPQFWLDQEDSLTRIPKGFPADSPEGKYLRLKTFCLCHHPSTEFITSKEMIQDTIALFRSTYPFTQYINRAIHYAKTEL